MEKGDRVIVPPYRSWNEAGEPIMVTDQTHMQGYIAEMKPTATGPQDEPMPRTDWLAWVVLDHPIGAQDVIQCRVSELRRTEG